MHAFSVAYGVGMKGRIIKGIAGFYYVYCEDGRLYECKAKGIFRNKSIKPLVGDDVIIDIVDGEKLLGNVSDILPRRSELIRPAVANVDQALVVFAMSEPAPNIGLLDRFLVMMEGYGLDTIICFNKADQTDSGEIKKYEEIYAPAGYRVMSASTYSGEGMDALSDALKGHTTALAGPSGVGKSSILNYLVPNAGMETGEVSDKIGRGRHTTRHSQVFVVDEDTFVFDTPGFSSLSVMAADREALRLAFPEMARLEGSCRFTGCVHINEPDCAVKKALSDGAIHESRYKSYLEMFREVKNERK